MSSKARPVKYLSEWQRIYSDPWLLSLVSWLPPLCFLIVYLIFSQGLGKRTANWNCGSWPEQPFTQDDQELRCQPDPPCYKYFSLTPGRYQRPAWRWNIRPCAFPENMEKEAILGQTPQVDAFFNNQFLLIGKLVKSAILSVHATTVAQVDTRKNLGTSTPVIGQVMGAAIPIGS